MTKRCLASVLATRSPLTQRVVIVNDGSDHETSTWLSGFASANRNVLQIKHESAKGYTKAANAGLAVLDADFAILLNSDTIVAGRWIMKLLDAAFSVPGVGMVGPLSNAASWQSIPNHRSAKDQTAINALPPGFSVEDMNTWCESQSCASSLPMVPLLHGFCLGIKAEVIRAVGGFDERNFPDGYGEENDYAFRVANAGFALVAASHTYVYHEKSQSYPNETRISLSRAGNMKLQLLHGRDRTRRAVRSMQENPEFRRLRTAAAELF